MKLLLLVTNTIFLLVLTNTLYSQCNSTTADIRYIGPSSYSNSGVSHTQTWTLQNIASCNAQDFSIEEFPEVYKWTGTNWVSITNPNFISNINNPKFSLAAGGTGIAEVSFDFTQPINGDYRIFFRIKDQYNSPLDNLCAIQPHKCRLYADVTIGSTAPLPNLTTSNLSVPSNTTSGGSITVSSSINNIGGGFSGTNRWVVWYSSTPMLNPYDSEELGYNTIPFINAGTSTTSTKTVTLPSGLAAGQHYVCFQADKNNTVLESDESDNITCTPITILAPAYHDFTTTNEVVSPSIVAQGDYITADCYTNYIGSSSATAQTAIYISTTTNLTNSSIFLGSFTPTTLSTSNPAQALSKSFLIPSTTAARNYYVLFVSDDNDDVGEGIAGEANNVQVGGSITITFAEDVTVTNVGIDKTYVIPGGTITTYCDQQYSGNFPYSRNIKVGYYLSTTPQWTANDTLLSSDQSSIYNSNNTEFETQSLLIPSNTPDGTYYILFYADYPDDIHETNENNNIIASVPFVISNTPPAADFTINNLTIANTSLAVNNTTVVTCDHVFVGQKTGNPIKVSFVLSEDNIFDISDYGYNLTSNSMESNFPNTTYTTTVTKTFKVPNDIPPGSYYLLAKADEANKVNEGNFENNNTQSYATQIKIIPTSITPLSQGFTRAEEYVCPLGDPVNGATGEFIQKQRDMELYAFGQAFPWQRYYHSNSGYNEDLGHGWSHSYDIHLSIAPKQWTVHYGDGHTEDFVYYHDGSTLPLYWPVKDTIYQNADSSYTLEKPNGVIYNFNTDGKIQSILDQAGVGLLFEYIGTNLSKVYLPSGRYYSITYQNNKISTVSDNSSRSISYQYDANENLISYTNTRNGTFQYNYDSQNRITSIVDPKGIMFVQNTYNIDGQVIQQLDADNNLSTFLYTIGSSTLTTTFTNPSNEVEAYTFFKSNRQLYYIKDAQGNYKNFNYTPDLKLKTITDQENNQAWATYQYQSDRFRTSNPIRMFNPIGDRVDIKYNNLDLPITIIKALRDTTTIVYDSLRNPLTITYPNGSQTHSTYNALGQLLTSIDPNGNITSYTYNAKGDLTTVTTPTGDYTFQYDQVGRVISSTDRNGNTTQMSFDPYGNILSITDAMGFSIIASYDANGNLDTITNKNGVSTYFEYDLMDRIIKVTNALGQEVNYTYDAVGRLIQATDANGNSSSYTYNLMGWLSTQTNDLGTTSYTYDKIGNVLTATNALGNTVFTKTYDKLSRVTSSQDMLGNISSIVYDHNNRQITTIDPNNNANVYQYNVMGWLSTVTDANGGQNSMNYDLNGNLLNIIDANNHSISYTYNSINLPLSQTYQGGYSTTFQYNNEGNVLQKTDANGMISNFNYDNNYRVNSVNYSNGEVYSFGYDDNGALINMANSNGITTIVRDPLGRTISTTDPFGRKVQYGYDVVGNNTELIYPTGDTVKMTYNTVGLQTRIEDWLGNFSSRTYDALGQLSTIHNSNGTSTTITRDGLGRMIAYDNYLGSGARFYSDSLLYDARGSITKVTSDNLLAPNFVEGASNYTYGGDDRMQTSPLGTHNHNAKGARTSTTGTINASYTWGENDLLKQYTVNGQTIQNQFNPLHQAISKTKNGIETQYTYSNMGSLLYSSIQEFDANNNPKSSTIQAADGIAWQLDSLGQAIFPSYTYIGHTKALTNILGDTTDIYAYDAFGNYFAHRGSNLYNLTFLGKWGIIQEPDNHYHIRARYYDAVNGRFVSKDKAALEGGNTQGVNRYNYTTNNPFNAIDINGYDIFLIHWNSNFASNGHSAIAISNYGEDSETPLGTFKYFDLWGGTDINGNGVGDRECTTCSDIGYVLGVPAYYSNKNFTPNSFIEQILKQTPAYRLPDGVIQLHTTFEQDLGIKSHIERYIKEEQTYYAKTNNCSDLTTSAISLLFNMSKTKLESIIDETYYSYKITTPNSLYRYVLKKVIKDNSLGQEIINPGKEVDILYRNR